MNDIQRQQIHDLRNAGYRYKKIAQKLEINENTVKTYCKRHGLGGIAKAPASINEPFHQCLYCGTDIQQQLGRKPKKFCSDICRNKWWNEHPDKVRRKAYYHLICRHCKKEFISYGNKERKYCSHNCYIRERFGGDKNEKQIM